ncbi:hypothetical protein bthur0005_2980 [Bacillus thuringiensis serovar pakistani str. T13001]|nr:hypothetical protein bthur0005_2980 [Bacillus thuringiensis serovar pakistani str. T13001]
MEKKEIAREVAVKWILSGITVNEEEQLNKILSKIHTENK